MAEKDDDDEIYDPAVSSSKVSNFRALCCISLSCYRKDTIENKLLL